MTTKTIITRHSETWWAVLTEDYEGVWCKDFLLDGRSQGAGKPPIHVCEFLGLGGINSRWYIEEDFGTIDSLRLADGNGSTFRFLPNSDTIEFVVDYTTSVGMPVICEVDFDSAYCISGGDDHAEDAEWSDHVYFDAVCGLGGWFLSATVDTLSSTDGLCTDDGPYASEDEAIYAGVTTALDWFYSNDIQPLFLAASVQPELQRVIAANNLQALFGNERETSDDE